MKEEARGRGKIELCAFCRVPIPTSEEEEIERTKKLVDVDNAYAFHALGGWYEGGTRQDLTKANELYRRAGELGCAVAWHSA